MKGQPLEELTCSSNQPGVASNASLKRHQARKRGHEMRKLLPIPPLLGRRLPNSGDIELLQVTESPMDNPQALGAGLLPKQLSFKKKRLQTSTCRLVGKHHAINTTTNQNEIMPVVLGAACHRLSRVLPLGIPHSFV